MNFDRLKAAIIGRGFEITSFISAIGMTKREWYARMNGNVSFKQRDISVIAQVLGLTGTEICSIFFADVVS